MGLNAVSLYRGASSCMTGIPALWLSRPPG
jgi:hypothetical protein